MENPFGSKSQSQEGISVTALLPIKDGLKYIASAKRQLSETCRDKDEILVIDDNSKDGTLNKLLEWATEDPRVRVIRNKGEGLVSALNLGLRESSNNWIARFDVDDRYASDRIDHQIKAIDLKTIAVFSDYEIWTPDSESLGQIPSPVDSDAVKISLISSRRTPHPSVLFSKDAALSIGGYRVEDFPAEDLSLWLRMSRIGNLVSIPKLLLNYELGKTSVTGQKRSLIIEKTHYLHKQIGIQDIILKSGMDRIDEILNSYEELTLGYERQILFLQELSKVMKFKQIPRMRFILPKLLSNVDAKMTGSVIRLSVEARKRRAYRSFG